MDLNWPKGGELHRCRCFYYCVPNWRARGNRLIDFSNETNCSCGTDTRPAVVCRAVVCVCRTSVAESVELIYVTQAKSIGIKWEM